MAIVRIENLRLRTIIGTYDHERGEKQDIIANITFKYDSSKPEQTDGLEGAVDYKALIDKIEEETGHAKFYLLEKLCRFILDIIIEDKQITAARVKLDKPDAIRFADCVSLELNYPEKPADEL